MQKPVAPSQLESSALWALLPMEIRTRCSYRRHDPQEPFYASQEDAERARADAETQYPNKGTLVAPVLLVCLPQGKLVLQCGTLSNAEHKTQEVLALALGRGVNAELVWELGFL